MYVRTLDRPGVLGILALACVLVAGGLLPTPAAQAAPFLLSENPQGGSDDLPDDFASLPTRWVPESTMRAS